MSSLNFILNSISSMLTHALTRPNRDELHNLVDRLVDAADGNRAQGEEIPTTQQHPTTEVSERRPVCSDTASQQQSDEIHIHRRNIQNQSAEQDSQIQTPDPLINSVPGRGNDSDADTFYSAQNDSNEIAQEYPVGFIEDETCDRRYRILYPKEYNG